MICCSCGKEIDINYGREYWNGIYCKKCADEMLSTPEYIKNYNYKRIIADLQAENAALKEKLEKAVELPCKIGDRFYIVEYYPPEIIEEECCDFSFIELSKILLDNGCGVTYELGDNGCFFVTLDKNEAIRIYNQKKEEQND